MSKMSTKTKVNPRAKRINNNNSNNTTKQQNNTSSKRNRTNLSSPETSPNPKIPATMANTNEALTIDVITKLLADQTKSLQTTMQNEIKTLGDELKNEFQSQITQLNDKIDANRANVQQQIDDLKVNVDQCMKHTSNTDDDVQRVIKLNELKISGIMHTNDENLNVIFNNMAKLVKFDLSCVNNVPALTRIFKHDKASNTSVPTPIVIAKFVASHIRNDFYRLYLNNIAAKQPIMTENIGLPSGTRIIIGENLTSTNHGIFVEASKLKKQGKLCQVFTQEGLVHVKAVKNTKATAIRSQNQLELFTLANPPMTSQPTTSSDVSNNNINNKTNSNSSTRNNNQN